MSRPLQFIRSLLFYTGYTLSVIIWGAIVLVIAPWVGQATRYRLLMAWNRFTIAWAAAICGIRYRIEGRENLPVRACVIVANHQSTWETVFLALLVPQLCILLKRELLRIPFFGWALRILRPIAIDRSNPRAALRQVVETGTERLANGWSVLIFPEGTRVDNGEALRFSRSAAQLAINAGVELVCIAHDAGKCWPARRFLKEPGVINVVIGVPLPSSDMDAGTLTRHAQDWIQQQLDGFANAG